MIAAVNPTHTSDAVGNLTPEAFADGANANLIPGQASLSLSGGINAGGAACVRHLAAKRIGGTDGVPGIDQGMVDFIEEMSGETFNIPIAKGGTRRAVFDIFSPNLISYQSGGLGQPLSYRHSGIGGWPRNSGAHLTIALTSAGPGDLKAGESYEARAVGGDGDGDPVDMYTAWTGQTRSRPYPPPNDEEQRREQELEKRTCHALREAYLDILDSSPLPLDATVGREVRDKDCNIEGVGQAGTRTRMRRASLSGTVYIERITDSVVIGRYDLSGTATVEREERTWSRRGPGLVDIKSDKDDQTLRVTGRFAAPNMRNSGFTVGLLEVAQAPSDGVAPVEKLRLIEHRPARNERNLPWKNPGIRLTFDRPLDPASVTPDAIKVEFGLADGQSGTVMAPIKISPRLAEVDTVVVTPLDPMRDGLRYRVTVRGGASGIRGAEGEQMAVDQAWGFETMVDLHDTEFMKAGLPRHLTWREGVESDIIQVVTNAPLVRDKPTAIRIYPKWRADPRIAPSWQVAEFEAHVRVRRVFSNAPLLLPERRNVRLRRPDRFSVEERRKGENSVTFFGWTPEFAEISALRAEIEPVQECGQSPKVFFGVEALDWDPLDRDFSFGYVFAEVGPWADGVPAERRQNGAQVAQSAETFIEQLFPVGEVHIEPGPAVPFPPDFVEDLASAIRDIAEDESFDADNSNSMALLRAAKGILRKLHLVDRLSAREDIRQEILRHTHDALTAAGAYREFDAVIVFMPFEWMQLLGIAEWDSGAHYMRPKSGEEVIFTRPIIGISLTVPGSGKPAIQSLGVIAHEVGHIYGLEHRPDFENARERDRICDSLDGTIANGIEGMRIAPSGDKGAVKSSEDGNAEKKGELLPLMFPCARGEKPSLFIMRDHYTKLLKTLRPNAFQTPLSSSP